MILWEGTPVSEEPLTKLEMLISFLLCTCLVGLALMPGVFEHGSLWITSAYLAGLLGLGFLTQLLIKRDLNDGS
jgi:hypothetical protein